MKRWKMVYDTYYKAADRVYATVQPFLKYSLVCGEADDTHHLITLRLDPAMEGHSIRVYTDQNGQQHIDLLAADEIGLQYAAVDFRNKYVPFARSSHLNGAVFHPFEEPMPDYFLETKPKIKERGLWTWGFVIYDYKKYIDNMVTLKLNTLIIWNDHVPDNIADVIEYAHANGVKLYLGFAWGWDQDCKDCMALDRAALARGVVETYETQYAHLGCDGIYFQSFTELQTEDVNGENIAKAVTDFVNRTGGILLERYPDLRLLFGLHAPSVKNRLEVIAKVDPRIAIIWEDLGSFPYHYEPSKIEDFKETFALTERVRDLRKTGGFGAVLKGLTSLNWTTFEHQEGNFLLGVSGADHIDTRKPDRMHILRYIQSYWLRNAKYALETIRAYPADAMVTVLNEDYLFEQYCGLPMALYAEMLWDPDRETEDILCETAMMPDIDFV